MTDFKPVRLQIAKLLTFIFVEVRKGSWYKDSDSSILE